MIILMLRANVRIMSVTVSTYGTVSSGTLSWGPLCYWQTYCSAIVSLSHLFYWECMELHLSLRGRGCSFSTTELDHTVGKTSGSGWARHVQESGMYLEANFTVWSPDLSSMGFCVSGHLKEHIYTLLAKTIEDFTARIQTAWRKFKSKHQVSRVRMPCGTLTSDLTRRKVVSETQCNYETPNDWLLDSSPHSTKTCYLEN